MQTASSRIWTRQVVAISTTLHVTPSIYGYVCLFVWLCVSVSAQLCKCMCLRLFVCVQLCVHVYTWICVCVRVLMFLYYLYIFTYIILKEKTKNEKKKNGRKPSRLNPFDIAQPALTIHGCLSIARDVCLWFGSWLTLTECLIVFC